MKIIHLADVHLDSPMTQNFGQQDARKRNAELLNTFHRTVEYAKENGCRVILIAGDLFDTARVSRASANFVLHEILESPGIDFFYLRGNHDEENTFQTGGIPENLHLFGEAWSTSKLPLKNGRLLAVSGKELRGRSPAEEGLDLDPRDFNIVMLHGELLAGESEIIQDPPRARGEEIRLAAFAGKGIDYLALGHIHKGGGGRIDCRGIWRYPGCLEGRGFDETGDHGFLLLEIEEETGFLTEEFVPIAFRRIFEIPVSAEGAAATAEIADRIEEALSASGAREKDMIRLILQGRVPADGEKDLTILRARFREGFFALEIRDETVPEVDYRLYERDRSLRGEFIRRVREAELPEEEKAEIIRLGLAALSGEALL